MSDRPAWYDEGLDHIWLPYTQMKTSPAPLPVVHTEGVYIHLADGRRLIDGIASWWTAVHGYNHPYILKAVRDQVGTMPHVMFGGLVHEQPLRLATRLAAITPGDLSRCFFAESGSVSVEVAMKMAVQYWINQGRDGRKTFLSFRGGYHGDTAMTMAVCDPDEGMHSHFRGYVPEQVIAGLPVDEESTARLDALLEKEGERLAGILIEPLIQGAAGMRLHDEATLRRIRNAADRHGLLLIADEIFTGLGRTGEMFACTRAGIAPDIMTLSKALTGGVLPLSAAIASERVFRAFWDDDPVKALMHGPTYMAHAGACAAANASLDLFGTEDRLPAVKDLQQKMQDGLSLLGKVDCVQDIRTLGAMAAVEVDPAALPAVQNLRARFIDRGVWVRPLGNVIYLTPAYIIPDAELNQLLDAVNSVVRSL